MQTLINPYKNQFQSTLTFQKSEKSTRINYFYGFQGQEQDDEIKGEGNSVNYNYRMHDPRVGRFFAVDPLTKSYPELTPYQFSSNSPIYMVELEGLEGKICVTTKWYTNKGIEKSKTKVYTVQGLKVDLIKICWKGHSDPSGPVKSIDYYGRNDDGTRTETSLKGVSPDAKPTVQELNTIFEKPIATSEYNAMPARSDDKYKMTWEGGAEAGNSDSDWSGERGARKFADGLEWTGDKISYIPTPITKVVGKTMSLAGKTYNQAMDFKYLNTEDAMHNLNVRLAQEAAGILIPKTVDAIMPNPANDYLNKQIIRLVISETAKPNIIKSDPKTGSQ